ncbi:hypothetical protein LQF12_02365 [Ruania suaedae]|uniref:hypothetical protein n=1 Tax=Ruania suaedae TaxID=2897774 RepID=UPI001E54B74B|nr:hypothetical protein [Ruania suaedae]UFU03477.1 hypothetical protein LQF12_02365 [Ruania suaedae]
MKFVPDVRRKEPVNVGIVVDSHGEWAARFFGQDPETGRIDGRTLRQKGLDRDVFEAWVAYYQRKMTDDLWVDVEKMQARKTHLIYTDPGGTLFEDRPVRQVADELFEDLVAGQVPEPTVSASDRLKLAVEKVLAQLEVVPEIDPTFEVSWDRAHRAPISFHYGYQNGQYHLMHRLNLTTQNSAAPTDYWARAQAARSAGEADNFVAFYSMQALGGIADVDRVLAPVEANGPAIDIDDFAKATTDLEAVFHPS